MIRCFFICVLMSLSFLTFANKDAEKLKDIIDIVLYHEGSQLVNNKVETSKYGVRTLLLNEYNKQHKTSYKIQTLTKKQAEKIATYLFKQYRLDELKNFSTQVVLFDTFFNSGYRNATVMTQKALNIYYKKSKKSIKKLDIDGVLGSKTIKALNSLKNSDRFNKIFLDIRLSSYQEYKLWDIYKNGWKRRIQFFAKSIEEQKKEVQKRNNS